MSRSACADPFGRPAPQSAERLDDDRDGPDQRERRVDDDDELPV
jgi:hypothetical protein